MKSKSKLAWTLFAIMTLAVIILSSILIYNIVKWKSGDELLGFDVDDVQSVHLRHYITATSELEIRDYDLTDEQIEYVVTEFRRSKFERTYEGAYNGKTVLTFTLEDGRKREFYTIDGIFYIDGKMYLCNSYLGRYIVHFGFGE